MGETKTTFYLSDALRTRLKQLAARRSTSVTLLLREGAELILERHEGQVGEADLQAALSAWERMRSAGLYSGSGLPTADQVDEVVYSQGSRQPARRTARRVRRPKR